MNANVPQGYVLLSENERIEHLKTFKRSNLINNKHAFKLFDSEAEV